jgi:hypothetical protein
LGWVSGFGVWKLLMGVGISTEGLVIFDEPRFDCFPGDSSTSLAMIDCESFIFGGVSPLDPDFESWLDGWIG